MQNNRALRDEESLELIKICGPTEADMIAEILANNGIDSTLQGEVAAATLPATGDLDAVRVWVQPKDADRARELVESFFDNSNSYAG